MRRKGQLSLEFLILASALLAFFAVFAAAFSGMRDSALAAIDVRNAKSFSYEANEKAQALALLGEGSEKPIGVNAIAEWRLESGGGGAFLLIPGPGGKNFSVAFPENISVRLRSGTFSGSRSFTLKKSGGKIILLD
ncbi:MAG TPA: hypothetical protein VFF09_01355 [archaeon]|nr:hypothetical protein [archaeon]